MIIIYIWYSCILTISASSTKISVVSAGIHSYLPHSSFLCSLLHSDLMRDLCGISFPPNKHKFWYKYIIKIIRGKGLICNLLSMFCIVNKKKIEHSITNGYPASSLTPAKQLTEGPCSWFNGDHHICDDVICLRL